MITQVFRAAAGMAMCALTCCAHAEDLESRHRVLLQAQIRYEIDDLDGKTEDGDLSVNRLSADFHGSVGIPQLQYRLQVDLLGEPLSYRDAWIGYSFSPEWSLKIGQHSMPFGLPRFIAQPFRTFTELSISASQFEPPRSRSLGMRLDGADTNGKWALRLGLYDGRGPMVRRAPEARGHLVSMRGVYALSGKVVEEPAPMEVRPQSDLVLGFGLMQANRNVQRGWLLRTSGETFDWPRPANLMGATADVFWRNGRLYVSLAGFLQYVHPEGSPRYRDAGYAVEAGWVFTKIGTRQAELVVRRSQFVRDLDEELLATRDLQSEIGLGLNWYQSGHRLKTQLDVLRRTSENGAREETRYILQQQVRY
jgi:hypothetical protein